MPFCLHLILFYRFFFVIIVKFIAVAVSYGLFDLCTNQLVARMVACKCFSNEDDSKSVEKKIERECVCSFFSGHCLLIVKSRIPNKQNST